MKNFIWVLIIFLLVVLEGALLKPLHLAPVNLVLLLVMASIMFSTLNQTLLLAVAGGIIVDFVSATPDGFFALIFLGTSLTVYFLFNQLLSRHPGRLVMFGSVVFASIVFNLWFLGLNSLFGIFHAARPLLLSDFLLRQVSLALVFNLLFAYPMFEGYSYVQSLRKR